MCQFQEEQRDINTYLEYSGFGEEERQVWSDVKFGELLVVVVIVDGVVDDDDDVVDDVVVDDEVESRIVVVWQ